MKIKKKERKKKNWTTVTDDVTEDTHCPNKRAKIKAWFSLGDSSTKKQHGHRIHLKYSRHIKGMTVTPHYHFIFFAL